MSAKNVTLRQLRAFVKVADKGSFVAAAPLVGLSQPALSQCISQLEDQIGSPLLQRTTRTVALTPIGVALLPHARKLLSQFDAVMAEVQDVVARRSGRTVVACLPSLAYRLMPLVTTAIKRRHPGLNVVVKDTNLKGVIESVVSGESDLGIGGFIGHHHSEVESSILATDVFHVVCPREHVFARSAKVRWRELANYPFIGMGHETGIHELLNEAMEKHGFQLQFVAEVSQLATLNGMIDEGIGISAISSLMLPREKHSSLVHRPLIEPIITRTIRVMWRSGAALSPAASAVFETLDVMLAEGTLRHTWVDVHWSKALGRPKMRGARRDDGELEIK